MLLERFPNLQHYPNPKQHKQVGNASKYLYRLNGTLKEIYPCYKYSLKCFKVDIISMLLERFPNLQHYPNPKQHKGVGNASKYLYRLNGTLKETYPCYKYSLKYFKVDIISMFVERELFSLTQQYQDVVANRLER